MPIPTYLLSKPLTPDQIAEIQYRYPKERVTIKQLADQYGVTKRDIRKILGKVKVSEHRGQKLTPELVRQIRDRVARSKSGEGPRLSYHQLAAEYGVSSVTIYYVVSRRTWVNVNQT